MTAHKHPLGAAAGFSPVPAVAPTPCPAVAAEVSPASVAAVTCPDCDGPFSYRIVDEDTRCSYPVDDGEHFCSGCDSIWTDDALELSGFADSDLVYVERIAPGRVAL